MSPRSTIAEVAARLEAIPTDTIYDVLDEFGHGDRCCLSNKITPLVAGRSLAGPVYTVRFTRDPRTTAEWNPPQLPTITSRFEAITPGDVIVVDGGGDRSAGHWGEVLSRIAQQFGARGAVVDGGTRDTRGLAALDDWLLFARYSSPIEAIRRLRVHEVDVPLFLHGALGPVPVHPEDWIVADEDGVVIIPSAELQRVLDRAEVVEQADLQAQLAISAGENIQEVYDRYRRA